LNRGANVFYYDPYVTDLEINTEIFKSLDNFYEDFIKSFDCILILTAHSNVNYDLVYKNANIIVDTRNDIKMRRKGLFKLGEPGL